jgi:hypothetical protein
MSVGKNHDQAGGRVDPRARDAALERLRRTRRWALGAAAALTAGFAALVSAVAPGRTLAHNSAGDATSSQSSGASGASTSSQLPPLATPSQLGLSGPDQPPQPSTTTSPAPTPDPSPAPTASPAPTDSSAPSGGGAAVVSGGS